MTDIPTDEAEREYRAMIAILDIAAKGERTLSASFAGHVRDELARLYTEKAKLVEALKDAHEAIEALIHSEQNPHSYRIESKAGDAVMKARKSKRAALSRAQSDPHDSEGETG